MSSELRWNPFAALQQHRTEHHEATTDDGPEPDADQGKRTDEPPKPPNMNDIIRRAAGIETPRDRHGNRIPEVGGD